MDYKTFPCPNCREIIDTTMQTCRFCSTPIDPAEAVAAAANQELVQKACGQASSARITAWTMPIFFLLHFAPFIGLIGLAGIVATSVIVPISVIRWRSRYGRLGSSDPDLPRARRTISEATVVWGVMLFIALSWFGLSSLLRP